MAIQWTTARALIVALACSASLVLPGCGKDEPPAQPGAAGEAPPAPPPVAQASSAAESQWTPEALEDLLAPVALYPDPVLAQVLATSTNPQEVLDAGNWLIQNPNLSGKELESAASAAGFTPPMIALVQFPTVVDMMCMQMEWTNELGTAFRADEPAMVPLVTLPMWWPCASKITAPSRTGTRSSPTRPTRLLGAPPARWPSMAPAPG